MRILSPISTDRAVAQICPSDELSVSDPQSDFKPDFKFLPEQILSAALHHCWSLKQLDPQWTGLLQTEDLPGIEGSSWTWPSYLGPILGFKLFCVLSGSANLEGTIPWTAMSANLKAALQRTVCIFTDIVTTSQSQLPGEGNN